MVNDYAVGGLFVLIWTISHTINYPLKDEGREFMTEVCTYEWTVYT